MKTTGKLRDISIDYSTGKRLLTFIVDHVGDDEVNRLSECEKIRITAVKYRKKRSLDANSYFWVLINKITEVQRYISDMYLHDKFLSENRAYILDEQGALVWDVTSEEPDQFGLVKRKTGDGHFAYWIDSGMVVNLEFQNGINKGKKLVDKRTGEPTQGHVMWRIKGTHEMDSKEMSKIIDSVVFEAKELGIETMPPAEIERMLSEWQPKEVKL